jgi:hypothetical protein
VWVFLSIQTDNGRVAGWTSLSFPNAVGSADEDPPALRFDVELAVPTDMLADRLWTQANIYDSIGRQVGTARLEVPPLAYAPAPTASSEATFVPAVLRGFRPGAHFPLLDASWEDEP